METIKIKYIPALFPDIDFESIINTYNTRFYKVPTGETTIIKTAESLRVSYGISEISESKHHLIQSYYYDKYILDIYLKENQDIANIQLGEQLEIYTSSGEIFEGELIEISEAEKIENTYNFKVSISIKKISEDNESINNYLTKEYLLSRFNELQLNYIELTNSKNIGESSDIYFIDFQAGESLKIYSKFHYKIERSKIDEDIIEKYNGKKVFVSSKDVGVIMIRTYIDEKEKYQLQKYGKRCDTINFFYTDTNQSTQVIDTEYIEFEITDNSNLIDIYQCDIKLYFNTIDYNRFE